MQDNQKIEEIFGFDPSNDRVLGAFNDNVHVEIISGNEFVVFVIPFKEYQRVWRNWLNGKQDYCERFNHYCGVMGYVYPVKYVKQDFQTNLNIWNPVIEDYEVKKADTYFVSKFDDHHDFEHG